MLVAFDLDYILFFLLRYKVKKNWKVSVVGPDVNVFVVLLGNRISKFKRVLFGFELSVSWQKYLTLRPVYIEAPWVTFQNKC